MENQRSNLQSFPFVSSVANSEANKNVWDDICKIDFSRVSTKVMLEQNWSEQETRLAVNSYKIFLFLSYLAHNEKKTIAPFTKVDVIWHAHILQSVVRYVAEVNEALGFTLDHISYLPGQNLSPNTALMADYLESNYLPMVVHNLEHANCDGSSICEFSDGQ